jgi:hypothetical protein
MIWYTALTLSWSYWGQLLKSSVWKACFLAKIWTRNLQNAKNERYPLDRYFRSSRRGLSGSIGHSGCDDEVSSEMWCIKRCFRRRFRFYSVVTHASYYFMWADWTSPMKFCLSFMWNTRKCCVLQSVSSVSLSCRNSSKFVKWFVVRNMLCDTHHHFWLTMCTVCAASRERIKQQPFQWSYQLRTV